MTLESLEDFNRKRRDAYQIRNDNAPRPNGIACPDCGAELLDTSPDRMLMSKPPQKNVHCPACCYRGFRVA